MIEIFWHDCVGMRRQGFEMVYWFQVIFQGADVIMPCFQEAKFLLELQFILIFCCTLLNGYLRNYRFIVAEIGVSWRERSVTKGSSREQNTGAVRSGWKINNLPAINYTLSFLWFRHVGIEGIRKNFQDECNYCWLKWSSLTYWYRWYIDMKLSVKRCVELMELCRL